MILDRILTEKDIGELDEIFKECIRSLEGKEVDHTKFNEASDRYYVWKKRLFGL